MPATYEPIATTTLVSAAASITFSSIPATYTDLRLVAVGKRASGGALAFQFNADTSTNYSRTALVGDGAAASSNRDVNQIYFSTNSWNDTYEFMYTIDIFSYINSTNKTCLISMCGDQNGLGSIRNFVGLWRNTSSINRVDLLITSGTIAAGFTATLYGIKNA